MKLLILVGWCVLLANVLSYSQTVELTTAETMVNLASPSSQKIYRVTDTNKAGDWQYDASDTQSAENIGTILVSLQPTNKGRFKRLYSKADGVNIDWFIAESTIDKALVRAVGVSEKVYFGATTYRIGQIGIGSSQLVNPKKLVLQFNKSILKTIDKSPIVNVLSFSDISHLALDGQATFDGNASTSDINITLTPQNHSFLKIISPLVYSQQSKLIFGAITIVNMPYCGVTVDTRGNDDIYDQIFIKTFREVNGFNQMNLQNPDFPVWGVNIRGGHRVVRVDTLFAQQDKEPWGDASVEKTYYTFSFENEVNPTTNRRKDSLYIKHIEAQYACGIILYTQAVNHVLIDNYLINNTLRKPTVADDKVYPAMRQKNLSWVGSKHTWTSFRSPNSSFRVKNLVIKNTNPTFMNQTNTNDITGFWLNKAMSGAIFDRIETDVRLKFYGDGSYSGFRDIPDGGHWVRSFVSRIPAKKNYVQSFNADLQIDTLYLAKGAAGNYTMENARIKAISQEVGTTAIFENRENTDKGNKLGFVVEACNATDILWQFKWDVANQSSDTTVVEKYIFRKFNGNNYVQFHTSSGAIYVTPLRYSTDLNLQQSIKQYLGIISFDWEGVAIKIKTSTLSQGDISSKYFTPNNSGLLQISSQKEKHSFKDFTVTNL